MKKVTLIVILLIAINTGIFSQSMIGGHPVDKEYYEAVDRWVMFPKQDSDSTYYYGFIYIDPQAGFTYQAGSEFKIDKDGKFVSGPIDQTKNIKVRLPERWGLVGIIPNYRLEELGLPEYPDWLKFYKSDENDVSYMVSIGYFYNHVGACNTALDILNKAYSIEPHHKGLEFELSFAYNALGQYENAIPVLEKAIDNNPNDFFFYRELGFSLCNINKPEDAETVYIKGIEICDNDPQKSEMAVNMAQAYFLSKNKTKFDEWYKITKKYVEKDSQIDQFIEMLMEKIDNE